MHTLSRQAVAAIASRHRSLVAAALALMLFTTLVANGVAHAQPVGGFFVGGAPASTYTGPGDIVPNAAMWWGLRAYNKAFAVASSAAINVERASDSTTEDIHVLSSGALDIASAMAFAGTDAVCTGTISSTTLSITSCASGTLHVNDPISGAGVSPGTIISSIGTCGSGSGTCTLNIPSTVSSSETVTATVALSIMKFYDQTGSGNTQNAIQFSSAFQLVPNCLGALPCGVAVGRINTGSLATITAINQPLTLSYVAERTGTFTSASVAISTFQSGSQIVDQWNSTANQMSMYAGSRVNFTAADSAWHAEQSVYNGATSVAYLDGTANSVSPGTGATSTQVSLGNNPAGGSVANLFGNMVEAGIWGSAFNSTQQAAMNANQHTYWGF